MNHRENSLEWKCKCFAFFLLCGGLLSTYLGKEADYDLLNYHLYNPWAFLHGRLLVDGFPASLQSSFNPIVDIPFYLAAKSLPDYITVFLTGMPIGFALYVIWDLLGVLDPERSIWHWVNRALTCVLAVSGAACLSQANSQTNEILVSTLALLGVSLCIRATIDGHNINRTLIKAGLSLGLAAGLKLTGLVPVLAVSLSLPALMYGGLGMRRALTVLAPSIVIGFLLSAGPWMLKLYIDFHNPLFPFFNSVFHSPLLDRDSMKDLRFLPENGWKVLEFPLFGAFVKNQLHSEIAMRDPRLLIGSLISLFWLVQIPWKRLKGEQLDTSAPIQLFLAMTFVLGYVVGMSFFGIYRYMIMQEFLVAIMAFMVLAKLLTERRIAKAIGLTSIIYAGCFALTVVPQWGSVDATGDRYFHTVLPRLPNGAMVIDITPNPIGYLLPQWPGHPPVVNPNSALTRPGLNEPIQHILTHRIYSNKGPIYLLLDNHNPSDVAKHLMQVYQITPVESQCQTIPDTVGPLLMICPAERAPETNLDGFDYKRAQNAPFLGGYFPINAGDGVWIGRAAFINFTTDSVARHQSLLINGQIPLDLLLKASPGTRSVKVDIYIGDALVGETSLTKDDSFNLVIPTKFILNHADGLPIVSVGIRVSASAVPAKVGANPDVRTLSAMINQIVLTD